MALIFILLTQLVNQTTFNLVFQADHGRRLLPELPPGKARLTKQSPVVRLLKSDPDWKIRVLIDGESTGIELDPQTIVKYVRVVFVFESDVNVLRVEGVPENRSSDFLLRHRYFGWMRNFYWSRRPAELIDRFDSKLATKLGNLEGDCQYLAPFVDITLQKRYASLLKESPRKNTQDAFRDDKNKEGKTEGPQARPVPPGPTVRTGERMSIDDSKYNINISQSNATTADHQVRPRDVIPRPLDPLKRSEGQISIDNYINIPRPRDDESSTNVVEKGCCVHGTILVFAFMVFVSIEILLFGSIDYE